MSFSANPSGFPDARYIVIKESDLYEAGRSGLVTIGQLSTLVAIQTAVADIRRMSHKPPLESLTIEKNWPEYEPTFELLAARILAEINAVGGC